MERVEKAKQAYYGGEIAKEEKILAEAIEKFQSLLDEGNLQSDEEKKKNGELLTRLKYQQRMQSKQVFNNGELLYAYTASIHKQPKEVVEILVYDEGHPVHELIVAWEKISAMIDEVTAAIDSLKKKGQMPPEEGAFYPKDLSKLTEHTPPRDNESIIAHSSDPGFEENVEKTMLTKRSRDHLETERQKRQEEIENRPQNTPGNTRVNPERENLTDPLEDMENAQLQYHPHQKWVKHEQKRKYKPDEQFPISSKITPTYIENLQALSLNISGNFKQHRVLQKQEQNTRREFTQERQRDSPEHTNVKSSGQEPFDPFKKTENSQLNRPLGEWIQHYANQKLETREGYPIDEENTSGIVERFQTTSTNSGEFDERVGEWIQDRAEPKLGAREGLFSSGNTPTGILKGLQASSTSSGIADERIRLTGLNDNSGVELHNFVPRQHSMMQEPRLIITTTKTYEIPGTVPAVHGFLHCTEEIRICRQTGKLVHEKTNKKISTEKNEN
ncbi:Oidioi.mRNA.OKI2018_I69.chr2.g7156.t1.cds [Oikopleura dioica]|uniref:Oidioi.mRNA.OKI2018_I69.chr2.g7156.t1.cds n=1 Tax=Oikopleura dioica TaxID=34765 RepID=A0ABN7TA29_OIKDI|nr:Oidioi.mRNA.OKI2018_I69.chr2.g7156.t1.cds [Oikopleura dioica]